MQKTKDEEMRYRVEKEEISRAIKNTNRDQLGELGQAKKREMEGLADQRDEVRGQETRLRKEIEQMEAKMHA